MVGDTVVSVAIPCLYHRQCKLIAAHPSIGDHDNNQRHNLHLKWWSALVGIVVNPQIIRQVQILDKPYVPSTDIAINMSLGSTTFLNHPDPSVDASSG